MRGTKYKPNSYTARSKILLMPPSYPSLTYEQNQYINDSQLLLQLHRITFDRQVTPKLQHESVSYSKFLKHMKMKIKEDNQMNQVIEEVYVNMCNGKKKHEKNQRSNFD
ncbi:Hypothetical_protein [Hexamita inflata]|uniref:Hypothetical_protein n=1 Tax=Hexamita inflata TaxID=28002 RepID=A0ABP1GNK6_9EUKA